MYHKMTTNICTSSIQEIHRIHH